jgi:hypothetical protein
VKSIKLVKIEGAVIMLKVANAVRYVRYILNGMSTDVLAVNLL